MNTTILLLTALIELSLWACHQLRIELNSRP